MNSMQDVMQIATNAVVWQMFLRVEDKPMHGVLYQAKEDYTQ